MNEYEYKYEDKCWFNGSCHLEKTKGCNKFCAMRREFDYLLFASEVPDKFKSYDKILLVIIPYNGGKINDLEKICAKFSVKFFVRKRGYLYGKTR